MVAEIAPQRLQATQLGGMSGIRGCPPSVEVRQGVYEGNGERNVSWAWADTGFAVSLRSGAVACAGAGRHLSSVSVVSFCKRFCLLADACATSHIALLQCFTRAQRFTRHEASHCHNGHTARASWLCTASYVTSSRPCSDALV